ncbi:MAG: hypothetical protein ACI9VR_000106 [Cognaticolwellia sp.]|jgi:hypothetical protein
MITALTLLAGLTACNEYELNPETDGYGAGDPQIAVAPEVLNFGELVRGDFSVMEFEVTNVGGGELLVSGIELGAGNDGFTILNDDLEFVLPAGASEAIQVEFTPFGVEQETLAIISSNDEMVPKATVDLLGGGLVPELEINPNPYDFGKTYVGCEQQANLSLTNVGTDSLDITSIDDFGTTDFGLSHSLSLPMTLAPGDSTELSIYFDPNEESAYTGEFVVNNTGPRASLIGIAEGEGKFTAEYKDKWTVPFDPPTDIMFLVDNSCSMDDDQARLANNFSYFIQNLDTYTNDWHVIVVGGDDGCKNNSAGILKSTTSGYESKFSTAVKQGTGSYLTEALLTPAALATEEAAKGSSGCNANFMRDGALLHIIMVSDEPEQSSGSWSNYVNRIQAAKGSASLVKLSAIVGDYPGGCGSADPGTGYYDAVNYTGGEFLSICASSWSSYMSALAKASISVDTYELQATPVESTLVVLVNDVEITSGWYYDEAANTVVFEKDIPEGGDVVKVSYAGKANCD